jgi:hypothetical protein
MTMLDFRPWLNDFVAHVQGWIPSFSCSKFLFFNIMLMHASEYETHNDQVSYFGKTNKILDKKIVFL